MDASIVRGCYDMLQKHARKNYSKGWDWVVECVEIGDFQRTCNDFNLDTWDKVLLHYTETVEIRADRDADIRAEADDAW